MDKPVWPTLSETQRRNNQGISGSSGNNNDNPFQIGHGKTFIPNSMNQNQSTPIKMAYPNSFLSTQLPSTSGHQLHQQYQPDKRSDNDFLKSFIDKLFHFLFSTLSDRFTFTDIINELNIFLLNFNTSSFAFSNKQNLPL